MGITVAVVHTEETPCMKKLVITWTFDTYHVIVHDVLLSADYFLQNLEHSYMITFVPAEWQTSWI